VEGSTRRPQIVHKWWNLSAEQGSADAQSDLGVMYQSGIGVPYDYKEALKLYRLAAEQGVTKESKDGNKWYQLAAEQSHAEVGCESLPHGLREETLIRFFQKLITPSFHRTQPNRPRITEKSMKRR
jgi:TPR repeat protein